MTTEHLNIPIHHVLHPFWVRASTVLFAPSGIKCVSTLLLFVWLLAGTQPLPAQTRTWTFDWTNRPEPGESTAAPTIDISSSETVEIIVRNINPILYDYRLSCTATAVSAATDAFAMFITGGQAGEAVDQQTCQGALNPIVKRIDDYLKQTAAGDELASVPVMKSDTDLKDFQKELLDIADLCNREPADSPTRVRYSDARAKLDYLLALPRQVSFFQTLDPGFSYECIVTESLGRRPTEKGTLQIQIGSAGDIATLSVGVLASALPNRTFEVATQPNAAGDGAENVLGVQGDSMSGNIAALINFRLPIGSRGFRLDGPSTGVDLSFGPVFQVGSAGQASSLGFFGGASFRLFKHFFITPGVHLGQVADYPLGFSAPGQPIPANFGTPTPVLRTTARFGLALTVRTNSFGDLARSRVTTLPTMPAPPPDGDPPADDPPTPPAAAAPSAVALCLSPVSAAGETKYTRNYVLKNSDPNTQWTAVRIMMDASTPPQGWAATGCDMARPLGFNETCPLQVTFTPAEGSPVPQNGQLIVIADRSPGQPKRITFNVSFEDGCPETTPGANQ